MAIKSVKTINKTRTDTSDSFTASNIILKKGEMAYESDTRKIKIGDGVTHWNSLEYIITPNSGVIKNLTTNIVIDDYNRRFLSLEFSMPSNDLFNQKIRNGSEKIKVYLYKMSKKGAVPNRGAYNKWVHPTKSIGIFSQDFYDSIKQNDCEKNYTMSYQAEEEASIPIAFEFGVECFHETINQQDYYIANDLYNLSELARQMVFFCDSSRVCPAEFEKRGKNIFLSIIEPRIQGYYECHVIGKRPIGRSNLKYRFKIVVGDKSYWSDTINIIYTYNSYSSKTMFGIRVE